MGGWDQVRARMKGDLDGIVASTLEGLAYGCGDAVLARTHLGRERRVLLAGRSPGALGGPGWPRVAYRKMRVSGRARRGSARPRRGGRCDKAFCNRQISIHEAIHRRKVVL